MKFPFLNHPQFQLLPQRQQRRSNAVDTRGVPHIGQPIYLLRRGFQAARQFGGTHILCNHFVE